MEPEQAVAAGQSQAAANVITEKSQNPKVGGLFPNGPLHEARRLPVLYSDFLATGSGANVDPFIGLAVIAGTVSNNFNNATPNHPGVARLFSSTSAFSGYYVGSNASQILLGGGEIMECIFQPIVFSNTLTRIGFLDTTSSADVTDGCYIEINSTGLLTAKTANNSTRTVGSLTTQLSLDTWYRLRVLVESSTKVSYKLTSEDGTELWVDQLTTNIPMVLGRETGVGIISTNSGTSAIALTAVDFLGMTYNSPRVR